MTRFNWQAEPENMMRWLVVTAINNIEKDGFTALTELTKNWTDVDLRLTINDVEVDARAFITSLERHFEVEVARQAGELIRSSGELGSLYHVVSILEETIRDDLARRAAQVGIDVNWDERY